MFVELKKHLAAYTILFLGLGIFIVFFFLFWPDHTQQRMVSIALGVFYFTWGVVSHVKTRHISPHVFFEYLATAALATFLLLMVTF
ncbi:MAG: hypothetical protein GW762_05720 [Candidatus Pacebacteria bacterium]|nr:hypothetical protein [Candidatus Paceibacterota bacterium]PIR63491.1 MAG: hypothetical protein COU64_04150 [Candidatus Pacebacteria bacterium CG10_big_fil_rev_8_21_14_0_10_40_26]PIZ78280.1 MAG: hypothetical protein COY01_05880 [Candidatus Pacebacteria bacterium CG_4_10_14_0_2_um_filter_40_20]PJA68675.1 MAG: hypothetical protein CO156_04165 [Candidatus Pacebacteria bacterium CG_4_9_14_3_um_filter_40_12]PJC41615.1 MAG: hypothetical protein CO041_02755 [Candidatus Pacebacteria bacterium CG_4_9_